MRKILILLIFTFSSLVSAADNEKLAIEIKQSVMAPCCWSGTVYDHGHSQMEEEIDKFVAEGKTKAEILDYYVGIYGERILAIPIASGFNLFAWIGPIFIAIVGVILIIVYIRSNKKLPDSRKPEKDREKHPAGKFDDEVEKELEKMDQ